MNQKNILLILFTLLGILALALALFIVLDTDGRVIDLEVTNLSDTTATIVWDSVDPVISEVVVSTEPLNQLKFQNSDAQIFLDDRDSEEERVPRTNHHVTITGLSPNERYYFRLNGSFFSFIQETERFRTFALDLEPETPNPAYGSVINFAVDGEEPTDGILVFKIQNENGEESALLSTTIDEDGDYAFDLSAMYHSDGSKFSFDQESSIVTINAVTDIGYGDGRLSLRETKPLPNVVVNIRYISPQFIN